MGWNAEMGDWGLVVGGRRWSGGFTALDRGGGAL